MKDEDEGQILLFFQSEGSQKVADEEMNINQDQIKQ